jgi:4-amino-4-deoxy-L-arabinose transferase-like glycosyltransferase
VNQSPRPDGKSPREFRAAILLLCVHFGLCLWSAVTQSVTHDEIWHLPVGVRNLRDGDFAADVLNPPVSRMWSAIPLVIAGVDVDRTMTGSAIGRKFVEDHPQTFHRWYVAGRVFNALWSVLAGIVLFVWGREVYGANGAVLGLLLYATAPNVIAHASLVTPDVPMMALYVTTLYLAFRWNRTVSWRGALIWGAVLGIAQGTKFTGLLLYPLIVAQTMLNLRRLPVRPWKLIAAQGAAAFCLSIVVLWGSYGFQGLLHPLASYRFQSSTLATLQQFFSFANWLPMPLPDAYLAGIDQQRAIMQSPHPVFLDGVWSVTGFREYYLKTLLYKLPHLMQLLFVLGFIAIVVRGNGTSRWQDRVTWLLPIGLLLAVASGEGMQLGVRYVLAMFPFLFLIAGGSAKLFSQTGKTSRFVLSAIVLLCGLSLRHQPHQIAYFNELAGGPVGGRYHLLDSNLDWGQDLAQVARVMRAQQLDRIGLAYFGTVPPQVLGIDYELPPSWQPRPGRYAVSVNYVMGRPHVVTQGDGSSRSTDFQEWGYFRFFTPQQTLGGSIDLYDLSSEDVSAWQKAMQQR